MKKENLTLKDLYVASVVLELLDEEEPWIQYESPGILNHVLAVSYRRILVYKATDENGVEHFYDLETGEICGYNEHMCCYQTESHWDVSRITTFPGFGYEQRLHGRIWLMGRNSGKIGFIETFEQFARERIGLNLHDIDVNTARRLVSIYNFAFGRRNIFSRKKYFVLPNDPEESMKFTTKILGKSALSGYSREKVKTR